MGEIRDRIMERIDDRDLRDALVEQKKKPETIFWGDPKFGPLRHQLMRAYKMVAEGKGQQRHGAGRAWNDQPIITISRTVGSGFAIGQAMKKLEESTRMDDVAAIHELLGAIGYICAAVQIIEEGER